MAHCLILGMTESGKTTLAKQIAAGFKKRGIGVIVLDPVGDPEWPADFRTSDVAEFQKVFWESRRCAVFFDESGDFLGQHDKLLHPTATRGRHWGHSCHYISQRGAMIARTVRDQCSHLFLFNSSLEDCKIHANEWNRPELKNANSLKKGEYYHCPRFGELKQHSAFGGKNDSKIADSSDN